MWVAINRFPLDPLNEEAWDIRLELDEIVGLEPNVEVEGPTDLESARVGLAQPEGPLSRECVIV
jgi:hypothetical protein